MKKLLLSFTKYASAFILTGILLINTTDSHAKKSAKLVADSTWEINPSLQSIESKDESIMLLLTFEAPNPIAFNLTVTDEFGEVLYQEAHETAVMKKFFKLLMAPETVERKVFVSLKTKANETHRFEVKSSIIEIPVMKIAKF